MTTSDEKKQDAASASWQQRSEVRLGSFFERLKGARVQMFVDKLGLGPDDIVLDLGSEDGSYLSKYYPYPHNIVIADIFEEPMKRGVEKNGLKGYRVIPAEGPLPFEDREFRAVWCNSVIEHVTVPRDILGEISNKDFYLQAEAHQKEFAKEISRISQAYFVQTPNKHFPIESHSIMPLVAYFSHRSRYRLSQATKRFWVKQWTSDFYLYDRRRFKAHYPDATEYADEKAFGLPKSLIAIRTA